MYIVLQANLLVDSGYWFVVSSDVSGISVPGAYAVVETGSVPTAE